MRVMGLGVRGNSPRNKAASASPPASSFGQIKSHVSWVWAVISRNALTTPPCSEGVKWYLRKTRTQISKEQIAAFTAVYDHNNRPVQALNDRALYLDENPSVVIR